MSLFSVSKSTFLMFINFRQDKLARLYIAAIILPTSKVKDVKDEVRIRKVLRDKPLKST
jgi:hypothetical protein